MTFYEENRSYSAWFEYAEPGLLTNRTIRNFLNGYRPESWPDVVKLTLLYGIVTLRKHTGSKGEVVPLEKIRQSVRQLEAAHCVENKLPPIQEKMKDLKGDVQEILEAFECGSSVKQNINSSPPKALLERKPVLAEQTRRPADTHVRSDNTPHRTPTCLAVFCDEG